MRPATACQGRHRPAENPPGQSAAERRIVAPILGAASSQHGRGTGDTRRRRLHPRSPPRPDRPCRATGSLTADRQRHPAAPVLLPAGGASASPGDFLAAIGKVRPHPRRRRAGTVGGVLVVSSDSSQTTGCRPRAENSSRCASQCLPDRPHSETGRRYSRDWVAAPRRRDGAIDGPRPGAGRSLRRRATFALRPVRGRLAASRCPGPSGRSRVVFPQARDIDGRHPRGTPIGGGRNPPR